MKKMVLILLTFLLCITNIKAVTKEELQDMVVSTALSYLHNNTYTDYDQLGMDADSAIKSSSTGATFNWRNPNVSPEAISRTNNFSIDCSSFSTIVTKYSLGYDFTDYVDLQSNYGYYKFSTNSNAFVYYKIGSTSITSQQQKERMLERFYNFHRGYDTRFFVAVAEKELGNPGVDVKKTSETKIGAYYYQFKDNSSVTERLNVYEDYKKYLQPGDIIVYVTTANKGHAMVYVGDAFGVGRPGFVHSTGSDFKQSGSTWAIGDDKYSVRFDSMETLAYRMQTNQVKKLVIVRPVNKYLKNGAYTEPSTLNSNAKARSDMKWLKIEQYATKKTPSIVNLSSSATDVPISINEYNSVNIGDQITYVLEIKNNSNKSYCFGTKGGNYDSSSSCTGGLTWQTSKNVKEYKTLTITATIPTNTTLVDGTIKCIQNKNENISCTQNNGTITCNVNKNNPLSASETLKLTYTVKVNGGTQITNTGIKVKYNKTLTMDPLTINVKPTNNKINAEQLRQSINKFKEYVTNGQVTYGTSNRAKFNATVPAKGKGTLTYSAYDFVGRIYYDAFGINMSEFTGANVKNAIFNKSSDVGAYGKKTTTQINALTNENYKKINKMLVEGFYGGRYLKGNDNKDRPGRLRPKDLEVGDIIVYYTTSNGTIAGDSVPYIYLGTDSNNKPSFIRFKSGNQFTTQTTSQFFLEFWTKDLFVVLRPSQLYGTTVKYSGGTISGKSSVVEYNTYKTLKDLTSTKEYTITFNYGAHECKDCLKTYTGKNTFGGWYLDAPDYTKPVKNTDALSDKKTHTIYAKWNNYVTLPKTTIEGYSLNNWYTNSALSGDSLQAGSEYKLTKNQTLYAKWTAHKYTVKYNANGGTGTTTSSTHTYGTSSKLTLNQFKKSGYVFEGWATSKTGEVKYLDGASVKNLSSKNNGTITLYAIWRVKEPDEFEVTLTLKNATSDATKKTIKKGSTATFTITPNKGYTNCKTNVDTLKITDNKLTISNVTKNTSVTVTCTGIKYSVIYNANGGKGTMENSSHTYGQAKELTANKYKRTGYSFRGWSKTINGTIKYKNKENVVNLTTSKNYNLYAVWSPITYKITYELNGGTLDNKITTYKITSDDIKLNIPKKEGYIFKGWTTTDNNTPQKEMIIKKGSYGNKIFTANYETGKYKITYRSDKYGTITGITEETLEYKSSPSGTTKTIKEGYKNLKWSVNKDVVLKDNTTILEGNPITESQIKQIVVKEDLVITAYHYTKKYKVSYSNGDKGKIKGITNEEVSHNSNPLGTKTSPNKGYKFKYWTANKNVKLKNGKTIAKGKQITDIKSIVVSENITLTPVFEKGTFKISYQSDDYGIINGNEIQNITYPNTLPLTQTSSLDENYEFQYWTANTDVSLSDDTEIKKGYPISNDELVKIIATNDMVLTANYSQQLFNVYYLNYEDIVVTENSKEIVSKTDFLTGPELDRNRWDKEIVYTSDKNVTLSSGKTIKAGKAITEEQLKQINVTEDLNITPRYENDLKLINFDKLNLDLILTIIFIVVAIPVGIYIIKSMKKNRMN